jgi:hypothetical protein
MPGLSGRVKPVSITADWVVPYHALYISLGDLSIHDLDVLHNTDLYGGVDLGGSGLISGSAAPLDPQDLVNKQYADFELAHLLAAKGDMLTSDGTIDMALSIGTENQKLLSSSLSPVGMSWVTVPLVVSQVITFDGPWAAPVTPVTPVVWVKMGYQIYMRIPDVISVYNHVVKISATGPTGMKTITGRHDTPVVVVDNGGINYIGIAEFYDTSPYFDIYRQNGAFTGPGNVGVYAQTICFNAA